MAAQLDDVRKLMAEVRQELAGKPNVIATGVGYKVSKGKQTDQLALICSVDTKKAKKSLAQSELVPAEIQGIPTDVNPTGIIYAQQGPTGMFRPAPGGVSIGHINITAGTLGCVVQKITRNIYCQIIMFWQTVTTLTLAIQFYSRVLQMAEVIQAIILQI